MIVAVAIYIGITTCSLSNAYFLDKRTKGLKTIFLFHPYNPSYPWSLQFRKKLS